MKELKQFVENRVQEFRRLTPTSAWKFCPGAENPADLSSQGMAPAERHSSMWLTGPSWLKKGEEPPRPAIEDDGTAIPGAAEQN